MLIEINEKVRSLTPPTKGDRYHGLAAPDHGTEKSRREALAEMFGVGLDESHALTLYDGLKLEIRRGDVVYVTGASGCGKSVLMRALERGLRERFEKSGEFEGGEGGVAGECDADDPQGPLASLEDVDVGGDAAVVDRFPGTLEEALRVVSIAGLNDAFLLLRPPRELSEGQRYRFRLAMVLAWGARTVLIDEFCSLLDRQTARAVAYRVRRYAERTGTTFIVATSHDDLVEDLRPSLLIRKRSAAAVEVRRP